MLNSLNISPVLCFTVSGLGDWETHSSQAPRAPSRSGHCKDTQGSCFIVILKAFSMQALSKAALDMVLNWKTAVASCTRNVYVSFLQQRKRLARIASPVPCLRCSAGTNLQPPPAWDQNPLACDTCPFSSLHVYSVFGSQKLRIVFQSHEVIFVLSVYYEFGVIGVWTHSTILTASHQHAFHSG